MREDVSAPPYRRTVFADVQGTVSGSMARLMMRRTVRLLRAQGTLPMYHQVSNGADRWLAGKLSHEVHVASQDSPASWVTTPCICACQQLAAQLSCFITSVVLQGHKYNIPVAVWLPEQYPTQPPQLFVEPTADMMISPGHSFVDASGGVRSSYIVSWDASRCAEALLRGRLSHPWTGRCIFIVGWRDTTAAPALLCIW